jgi:hypothetical protein
MVRRRRFCNLAIDSVLPVLDELNDETVGLATATCRGLLQHLRLHYRTITPDHLEANQCQLDRQWQPPAPLGDLFQQIKKCQHFAEAGNDPITNKTAVRSALKNVEATGLFADACHDWRKKAEAEQTLAAFKLDFSAADTERKRQTTSNTAGYHGAKNAVRAVVAAPSYFQLPSGQHSAQFSLLLVEWARPKFPAHQHHLSVPERRLHQTEATTLDNMMEGCRLIARPPRHPRTPATTHKNDPAGRLNHPADFIQDNLEVRNLFDGRRQ